MGLKNKDFLTLLDYTPEEIRYLLDLSKNLKRKNGTTFWVPFSSSIAVYLLFATAPEVP